MGTFRDLRVWQEAVNLAVDIYKITKQGEFVKDFGLKDQCQRSAVSISSNIAEGEELDTYKQALKHLYIAKGSCGELGTQLLIAYRINYLSKDDYSELEKRCLKISIMLKKLINTKKPPA
jgi:four helix bundle protein